MINEVVVEDTASPAEVTAVQDAFARAGFEVEVKPGYARRSVDLLPWIVSVVLATPIAAFFASFGAEAGKDAYAGVRAWLGDVFAVRRDSGNGTGAVELEDPDGTSLILSTRIPPEALDALATLDWDEKRGDYLIWNDSEGEWHDPLKDAR